MSHGKWIMELPPNRCQSKEIDIDTITEKLKFLVRDPLTISLAYIEGLPSHSFPLIVLAWLTNLAVPGSASRDHFQGLHSHKLRPAPPKKELPAALRSSERKETSWDRQPLRRRMGLSIPKNALNMLTGPG